MNISELNSKLVSELREIGKVLGIADVEKLRKQELIDKITEIAKQAEAEEKTEEAAPAPQPAGEERPRKRTRTVKAEPVAVTKRTKTEEETNGDSDSFRRRDACRFIYLFFNSYRIPFC
ncbi:Rho termination factor N-terminal domain-containing protein [Sphingobacterium sp. T2]|uniref:Rho termination factor N-terminal domain-containing protein n=1 Tax=Sphingobacterium sp. T2 TaxID=1590596 RepID=UPI00057BAE3E